MENRGPSRHYANIFQKSILFLSVISLFLFGSMAAIWSIRVTAITEKQAIASSQIALDTLYNLIREQHETFKRFQMDLYLFQYDRDTTMSEHLEAYLKDIHAGNDLTPIQKQETRQGINDYLRSVGSAMGNNALMLMVAGNEFSSSDPYVVLSNSVGNHYPRQIAQYVEEASGNTSRRSTQLLPGFVNPGERLSCESYVICDDFRSLNMPSRSSGTVVVTFRTDALNAALARLNTVPIGRFYVLNASGQIIYDSGNERAGETFEYFDSIGTASQIDLTAGGMRIHGIYNASFGFSVVNTFPMGESYPALLQEYLYIGLMTTAALLLCVTLCYLFFRRYLMKITLLLAGLSAAGKDLNHRIPVEGESDEIDSICIQTNAMLDTIQENIDKNYAQELEKQRALLQKRKAELYALQTQIDPHFVYNTLEMIRMQLVVKGDFTSADSIKLLGGILRQRIKGKSVRFLSSEIEQCRSLIELYNLNYTSEAILEAEIPGEYLDTAVIQDTLVPLVENILTHGKRTEGLLVNISLRAENEDLCLRVQDNGQGFSEAILQQLGELFEQNPKLQSESIGLLNLHQRLRLIYGPAYGLALHNAQQGGAVIDVRIRRMRIDELDALLSTYNQGISGAES